MDVNEEIVKEYFEIVQNCIVRNSIQYGKYHSDIDLLAINKNREVFDVEVKWKSRITIKDSNNKQNGFKYYVGQLKNEKRDYVIKELIGKKPTKKVLVTTKYFLTKKNFKYWINKFKKEGIEVIFFDDIIPELVSKVSGKGKYTSIILQTIRMLKCFGVTSE